MSETSSGGFLAHTGGNARCAKGLKGNRGQTAVSHCAASEAGTRWSMKKRNRADVNSYGAAQ